MLGKLAQTIAKLLGGGRGSRGSRGESMAEVLASVLIGGLALLMLAMAISVSSHIAVNSRQHMDDYYSANNTVVAGSGGALGSGTAALYDGGTAVSLAGNGSMTVQYWQNEQLEKETVLLYEAHEAGGA